jgi:hypothetical protein
MARQNLADWKRVAEITPAEGFVDGTEVLPYVHRIRTPVPTQRSVSARTLTPLDESRQAEFDRAAPRWRMPRESLGSWPPRWLGKTQLVTVKGFGLRGPSAACADWLRRSRFTPVDFASPGHPTESGPAGTRHSRVGLRQTLCILRYSRSVLTTSMLRRGSHHARWRNVPQPDHCAAKLPRASGTDLV